MSQPDLLDYRQHRLKPPSLAPFVKYAWTMRSQETESQSDLLIPDGYPEVIFVQRGAYRKTYLRTNQSTEITRSCAIGIQTQSVLACRLRCCRLIGIKLTPTGGHALLGQHLASLADRNQSIEGLGLAWLSRLDAQLQACETEAEAVDILSESLSQQVARLGESPLDPVATALLASVLETKGQITVKEMADRHCLSVRHLQRKFKGFFGISPKKFLTLIRFKSLYKASVLQDQSSVDFLVHGYYDQMHFIKDFRRHLGVNPSQRREPTFRQLNQMARRST
jgi:AraC-like DNA-binding protein